MSKILDWIKKHVWQTVLIGLALFFIPLIISHLLYKWQTPYYLLQSDWESGDLITYIAGFLSFLGSAALGAVAVNQNQKANELNEKLLNIEKEREASEIKPFIMLHDTESKHLKFDECFSGNIKYLCGEVDKSAMNSQVFKLTLHLVNVARTYVELEFNTLHFLMKDGIKSNVYIDQTAINFRKFHNNLAPSEKCSIDFVMLESDYSRILEASSVEVALTLRNCLNDLYHELIKFSVIIVPDFEVFGITALTYTIELG